MRRYSICIIRSLNSEQKIVSAPFTDKFADVQPPTTHVIYKVNARVEETASVAE